MMHCAKCHGLEHLSNEKKIGPSLGLMFNRKAGSDLSYRNYSHVLANSKIYWTANNLFRFMYNPTVFIMGIKCSGFTLKSEEDRADLI
jgi:cytochrome c2